MMTLDLSLSNPQLYQGLDVQELAGRLTLVTSPEEAIPQILRNLAAIPIDSDDVVLTGGMAIWAYLVVFHFLHGRTRRIWYEDGRGRGFSSRLTDELGRAATARRPPSSSRS